MLKRISPEARLRLALMVLPTVFLAVCIGWSFTSFFTSWSEIIGPLSALAFLLLTPIGVCMTVCATFNKRQDNYAALLKAWPLTQQNPSLVEGQVTVTQPRLPQIWGPRVVHRTLRTNPPAFTKLSVHVLLIFPVFFFVWMILALLQPLPPVGLVVNLVRRDLPTTSTIPPLRVRLKVIPHTQDLQVFVGRQPVPWDGLAAVLRLELKTRPSHSPVYVDGDPDMEFGDAARLVDLIRSLHGDVVLLTPADIKPDQHPK